MTTFPKLSLGVLRRHEKFSDLIGARPGIRTRLKATFGGNMFECPDVLSLYGIVRSLSRRDGNLRQVRRRFGSPGHTKRQ